MFQAGIHQDIHASIPSGLVLARGSLMNASFHYLNLMFQSKSKRKKKRQKNSIFQKQEVKNASWWVLNTVRTAFQKSVLIKPQFLLKIQLMLGKVPQEKVFKI